MHVFLLKSISYLLGADYEISIIDGISNHSQGKKERNIYIYKLNHPKWSHSFLHSSKYAMESIFLKVCIFVTKMKLKFGN